MKKLILILTFIPILTFSQVTKQTGIKMTTTYSSENQELQDILAFEKIDYFKVQFTGAELKNKNYYLLVKEIWNGKIRKIDTLVNTSRKKRLLPIKSDTLNIRVIAKKISEKTLKLTYKLPQVSIKRTFEATNSDLYSLRDVGSGIEIKSGKEFSSFAYIMPYEKDGWLLYCAVDSSGKDIESWGREFGIEHYLIFEMKFE